MNIRLLLSAMIDIGDGSAWSALPWGKCGITIYCLAISMFLCSYISLWNCTRNNARAADRARVLWILTEIGVCCAIAVIDLSIVPAFKSWFIAALSLQRMPTLTKALFLIPPGVCTTTLVLLCIATLLFTVTDCAKSSCRFRCGLYLTFAALALMYLTFAPIAIIVPFL